ncbi:outer membrane protein with beta-barrel domain [Dysgonomonas alginatilytica]|uniref:Outer membrane protein with beta-barrel domain n=1 Tax=Dysgonomonas alginatilytica TaxID=1605892 RepID=A0A2V3PWV2_9BACT|nr:porin family protein [Dysgonomonas alginatilytica]PXV69068.1 outer membrane protein with beta-barrel domain [Dysgonomonas alginatilytica]
MKSIYKLSILTFLSLMVLAASAQNYPVRFGVKAGANLINMAGDITDTDTKVAVQGGVTFDYAINPAFSLISGVELSTKGAKYQGTTFNDYFENAYNDVFVNINLLYLQVPVYAAYKMDVAPGTKFVFQAGPYVAYGLGGKTTIKDGVEKLEENSFSTGLVKNFDFGFGVGAGVEFDHIVTKIGYEFGVINVIDSSVGRLQNRNTYLTLGYQF